MMATWPGPTSSRSVLALTLSGGHACLLPEIDASRLTVLFSLLGEDFQVHPFLELKEVFDLWVRIGLGGEEHRLAP